uniref:Uncharacterized protein n=1 Tax=Glossina austeni TaxID=7395 RepID=A0A1A9VD79_GLOAU
MVESGSPAAYETSHTRPKDRLAIDFEKPTPVSSLRPLPGSGQQITSPEAGNTRSVPTGQRSDISMSESQRYRSADGASCQQEADTTPDGTDLRFEDNRISATVIIAGQRVTATVDTAATTIYSPEENSNDGIPNSNHRGIQENLEHLKCEYHFPNSIIKAAINTN